MSGRRAALRVAARNARHNRKRTIFLVLLVAVPVALGVVVAGMVRASTFTPEEQAQLELGTAEAGIEIGGQNDELLDWVYENLARIEPSLRVTDLRRAGVWLDEGSFAFVTDLDLTDPLTEGMYLLREGRPPSSPGEVAVSPDIAESLGLDFGDRTEFEALDLGELELVGIVSHPLAVSNSVILLSPGALKGSASVLGTTVLVGGSGAERAVASLRQLWDTEGRRSILPEPAVPKPKELEFLDDEIYAFLSADDVAELVELARTAPAESATGLVYRRASEIAFESNGGFQLSLGFQTRSGFLSMPRLEENSALISTAAAALLLLEVAFVTGAAFAAGTRRRLREIGLLGANGASKKHIRMTVIGEGLSIGAVGSALGVLLGVGLLGLGRPFIQRFATRLVTGLGVGVTDVVGPVAVALISVVVAVWIPARTASNVPTTTALQGRMPPSAPRKRTVPVGIGASLTGGLLVTVSLASRSSLGPVLVGVGGFLLVGGVALLASPILHGFSLLADRVPATSRLVLRDSGRHRTRASVAVSAIMVILLVPVIFLTAKAMSERQLLVAGLPEPPNHLLVQDRFTFGDAAPQPLTDADVAAVAAIVPARAIATFDTLGIVARTEAQLEPGTLGFQPGGHPEFRSLVFYGDETVNAAVASESLLEALGDERVTRAIEAGEIVVLGVEDRPTTVGLNGQELPATEVAISVLRWGMPRILIPPSVAEGFPEAKTRMIALFVLERPLTDTDREALRALTLSTVGGFDSLTDTTVYAIASGAALVAVLIVIALVTAVSAAEIDEELLVIVAVGAPGSFRRRFLGLLTGYQTLVAALLALPLGLGLIKVFALARDTVFIGPFGQVDGAVVPVPWLELGVFAAATPLVVGLLTLISVRSAPVTPPRRAT